MEKIEFKYQGKIVNIVDGDTLDVLLDLGFGVFKKVRCRLLKINAPEIKTPEGLQVKEYLKENFDGAPVIVVSKSLDRYGRSLAQVLIDGDRDLAKLLTEAFPAFFQTTM